MKIIRDNDLGGLAMIPLFVDWNIRRCNVGGCTAKPTTIVIGLADDLPNAGFCETHFQEANKPGGTIFSFEFDNYDAFKEKHNDGPRDN